MLSAERGGLARIDVAVRTGPEITHQFWPKLPKIMPYVSNMAPVIEVPCEAAYI